MYCILFNIYEIYNIYLMYNLFLLKYVCIDDCVILSCFLMIWKHTRLDRGD